MRLIGFVLFLVAPMACTHVKAPAPVGPLPSAAQMKWHRMEMNAFIHFTINTFTDLEWGMGSESPSLFNPSSFDANQWIETIQKAGFRGVILTCKHHDGFCLWPTSLTTHSVKNSPFQNGEGDVVRAVSDACKKYGLSFGVYLSPWDRNHAAYGTPAYIEYYRSQLKELFQQYGPVFEMWFDGANGGTGFYGGANEKRSIDGSTYYDWPGTLQMVREMEPNVIFFSDAGPGVRWVGNERGVAGETNWNTISTDTLFAGKAGIEHLLNTGDENGTKWVPAEVDVSIRPGWFYHASQDSLVKKPEQLFEIYLTSVGRGSTLLLNIPPDRRGLLNERDVESLRGFRELLDREFKTNLARGARISASATRGDDESFAPAHLIDGDTATYWATDDEVASAELEIILPRVSPVKYLVLQEEIKLGQRVRSFHVEYWSEGEWKTLVQATTIGYKRILRLDQVNTDRLKVVIDDAKACPVLANLEIY